MKQINISRKTLKKLKYGIVIVLVGFIIFGAFFLSARSVGNVAVSGVTDSFRRVFSSTSTGGYPHALENLNVREIKGIGDDVFVLYNDSAFVLTPRAKQLPVVQLDSADTRVEIRSGRALVYDRSRGYVCLMSESEKLGETTLESRIYNVALANNGTSAIVTGNEEGYLSMVKVYNTRLENTYYWGCASERIADVDFFDGGSKLAVLVVGVDNAELYSRILVFDTRDDEHHEETREDGTMFMQIRCTSSGKIIAAGDNKLCVYDSKCEVVNSVEYSEDLFSGVDFDDKGNAVVFLSEYGGTQTDIIRCTASGKIKFRVTLAGNATSVHIDGRKTVVQCGREITVLNGGGDATDAFELNSIPESIVCSNGKIYSLEDYSIIKY